MSFDEIIKKYKAILLVLIGIIILTGCSGNKDSSVNSKPRIENGEKLIFEHGGLDREYRIYVPQNLSTNAPLLFVLHGRDQFSDWTYELGFNELAEKNGFVVVYPQSTMIWYDQDKSTMIWNTKNDDTFFDDINDVDFLSELAKQLQIEYNLNEEQTFVAGFSNGGYMSYTLASEASEVFKGAASVAGLMRKEVYNNCDPEITVPILHIHGTSDPIVPISGITNRKDGATINYSGDEVIELWVRLNDCNSEPEKVKITDNTTAYYYRDGIRGNQVHYYKINSHGHTWPGLEVKKEGYVDNSGINATEIIWDFFNKY